MPIIPTQIATCALAPLQNNLNMPSGRMPAVLLQGPGCRVQAVEALDMQEPDYPS